MLQNSFDDLQIIYHSVEIGHDVQRQIHLLHVHLFLELIDLGLKPQVAHLVAELIFLLLVQALCTRVCERERWEFVRKQKCPRVRVHVQRLKISTKDLLIHMCVGGCKGV